MTPASQRTRRASARTTLFAGASAIALLTHPAGAQEPPQDAGSVLLPDIYVTATRIGSGIAGATTTVITADDIARSPEQSLPAILAREPGVQVQSVFGGPSGANSVVDVRGFGASGASNTLVLINGRRVNDLDIQGVDYAAIPRDSIERIEVTRGGSGAVLYGDGAVGGVINIITKQAADLPPRVRVETGFGSHGQKEGSLSARTSFGAHSFSFYGSAIGYDGYRDNNEYRQLNGVATYNYTADWGTIYANFSADNQRLGLPGARLVDLNTGVNQLVTDRRGAQTPFDFANKQGVNATLGVTVNLSPNAQLVIDGGVRQKSQQAGFFDTLSVPGSALPTNYVRATLTTSSISPRVKIETDLFGLPMKSLVGVDFYNSEYASPRSQSFGAAPIHVYDLSQNALSGYAMNTLTLRPGTDLSFGARLQHTMVSARDTLDLTAPGAVQCFGQFCFSDTQGRPLDSARTNHALHIGLEHRLNTHVTLFGRVAQSFRAPNVDERIGMTPDITSIPTTFDLRPQTSRDLEGGVRGRFGALDMQASVYHMDLKNEIHYSPATFSNVNLDPTRRYGAELSAGWQATDTLRVKAGYAYTRSVFREGAFDGNDVPLVSRNTASLGVDWSILDKRLVLGGVVRYVGARRMDNDQNNVQPKIPAFAIVDAHIGGEFDRYFWSLSVQNLFDKEYYDYAVASAFTIGRFNAYPQNGRAVVLRAGATF